MQSNNINANSKIHNLILLQNLFCINRSHWFERKFHRIFGNVIFYTTVTILIVIAILNITDLSKTNVIPPKSVLFAYSFKYLLVAELIPLAVLAKRDNMHVKLQALDEKCTSKPYFITKKEVTEATDSNSKIVVILSLLSAMVDLIGLNMLEYPSSVVSTLPLAFAAHDTELLLYSLIIKEFNAKLKTITEKNAEVGMRDYRNILVTASHFSEDYRFTISVMVLMTLMTTVLYIGAAVVIEGPRTHKVLSYMIYRELRSLLSLWILCSASFQTRILCTSYIKRLTERLVFELDTKDESSRELTKRLLRCVKSCHVRYLTNSCFTLNLALPLVLLDYTTNYLLIIVQMEWQFRYDRKEIRRKTESLMCSPRHGWFTKPSTKFSCDAES
ncbi:jg18733 [Pararge aegeria aegeria]|uniref:Jg18733 protein n=1 Tax=Pararge aegeria aegeria TaxID=348720 RepID=A0A8S4RMA4_9NEOP|nr:jg18733 [Pararge aegeria aegeria]